MLVYEIFQFIKIKEYLLDIEDCLLAVQARLCRPNRLLVA